MLNFFFQRNPDIKLYGLPWGFPGWIGQGTGNPYSNPNVTADYIVRWIAGAKTFYNLTIDFVGASCTQLFLHSMLPKYLCTKQYFKKKE